MKKITKSLFMFSLASMLLFGGSLSAFAHPVGVIDPTIVGGPSEGFGEALE